MISRGHTGSRPFPAETRRVRATARMSAPRFIVKHMIEELIATSPDQADASQADVAQADAGGPPLEWLETRLCELAGQLTAATSRFLVLLGDFDARRGWAAWDLPSCAAWRSGTCQLTSGTAREHVRVARALRDLPVLSAEFAAGRMSYAKVRALTRIAAPATEAGLAELAGPMTASQLERFVRAHRRVSRADDAAAASTQGGASGRGHQGRAGSAGGGADARGRARPA